MPRIAFVAWIVLLVLASVPAAQEDQAPVGGRLATRFARDVAPDRAHPEYPRPTMVREAWRCLNGLWDYAIRPREEGAPTAYDGKILVPYPIESSLSGVGRRVGEREVLWVRRGVAVPPEWKGRRVRLHFGAVDWEARVFVEGREAAVHRGGYDPFTVDLTAHLADLEARGAGAASEGGTDELEIVVAAWDPSDRGDQPRGKQVRHPGGIWYTPSTGIWQTVWMEPVPAEAHIGGLRIVPDLDAGVVRVAARGEGLGGRRLDVRVVAEGRQAAAGSGPADEPVAVPLDGARLWTPEKPFLYDLEITLLDGQRVVDRVRSYFGMRKISVEADAAGVRRICLNGRPRFLLGLLDQGFWPDGLYAAPTDEALRYDVEVSLRLGFNLARKHVKVEPERWYHWCDRLGLLVFQDMPSGDAFVDPGKGEIVRSAQSARQFEDELRRVIEARANHPSIVAWVPFNEGWGQYDTARIVDLVRRLDPTRLVVPASGWNDVPAGDVHDIHAYPGPAAVRPGERAAVLGEFGGLGLPVRGHTWQDERNWGYRSYEDREGLTEAYEDLIARLRPLVAWPGLSAAIYTQTTDVEIEINGMMTYDREVVKMDEERVAKANRSLFAPVPQVRIVVPTSEAEGLAWRYTTDAPPGGWEAVGFDDSSWRTGEGGFGTDGTPGATVRTEWSSGEIWARRTFDLADGESMFAGTPHLLVHHDEDAEVFVNGVLAARLPGFTTSYLLEPMREEARRTLRVGRNVLAVRCRQTGGGQYVDVGLADVVEGPGTHRRDR